MSNRTWQIDLSHAAINFSVRHLVVSKVRGKFTKWSGVIELNEQELEKSSARITIEAASVETHNEQRDAHLRSADFLDAEHHPTLTFASKRAEKLGDGKFRLVGDLTIRGTTREVAIDVEHEGTVKDPWGNDRAGFSGHATISRKDFGLTWNMMLEAGGVAVADKVELGFELEATAAAATTAAA